MCQRLSARGTRTITSVIESKIGSGKAIMIIGSRQVGKTMLILNQLHDKDYTFFDGDDPSVRAELDTPNTEKIRKLIGGKKIVFIDEAQRINGIGLTLKILIDQFKNVQLWISGSSSFDLFNKLNEPLTGRKWAYELFPISWEEYENHVGYLKAQQDLENRLIFGMYPDVVTNEKGQQQEIDYVEQNGLKLKAHEFKWNPKSKAKFSKAFLNAYNAESKLINRDNFRAFVII